MKVVSNNLLIFVIFLSICISIAQSITFQVPPRTKECFYETLEKGTEVGMVFQVLEGGSRDISVDVISPKEDTIYKAPDESEGKYFFVAFMKGRYTFCFDNERSKFTSKKVNMILNIGKQRTEEEIVASIVSGNEEKKVELPRELSLLQYSILQLSDGILSIQTEEKYLRLREQVHRDTTESTNSRVLLWALLETFSLIGMSLWQIYLIRRFFEVKRVI